MSSSAASRFSIAWRAEANLQGERQHLKVDVDLADASDEALMVRLKDDDLKALGLLFRRYNRVVRYICQRILRDKSEAEDLTQDVFLYLHRKSGIFDSSKGSAASWIVQMAYHRAFERRRYLAGRHYYDVEDIHDSVCHVRGKLTVEGDYSPEAVFGRNGLEKVLKTLSVDQRETLRLYFFEGYTLAEISVKLGQPLGNVRHHYYRGLDKLRKQMFERKDRSGENSRETQ
jgi:RNA polymerase sigma-70 factor, ECF subfamily